MSSVMQSPLVITAIIFVVAMVFFLPLIFLVAGGTQKKVAERAAKIGSGGAYQTQQKIQESLKKVKKDSDIKILDSILKSLPNLNRLRYRLEMSDSGINTGQYFMICFGVGAVNALTILVTTTMPVAFAVFFGIFTGFLLPHVVLNTKIRKKASKFVKLFPDAIELIVRGLRSGLPVQESFKVISDEIAEPVAGEFGRIAQNIKLGVPVDKALKDAADRLKLLEFDFFVTSLNLQRETGGNLAEILSNLAFTIRQRFLMKMKIRAISSEARASAWILGLLPFAVSGVLKIMNPRYLDPLFDDFTGNIVLIGCFVSLGIGVTIMKKMSSFDI